MISDCVPVAEYVGIFNQFFQWLPLSVKKRKKNTPLFFPPANTNGISDDDEVSAL